MATTPVDRRRHALDMQIRESLTGKHLVVAEEGFEIKRSLPHGHVAAIAAMANELKLPALLGPACRERDIIYALILARAIRPASKLATSRWFKDSTLGVDLGVVGISTDEIYSAMDWLYARQGTIEATLAKRHLQEDSRVLYDLSSSWMEGTHCPLAAYGYSRDHKRGKTQIEYGLMTDVDGRPISIEVFSGNTGDPSAFVNAVNMTRDRFGLRELIMVGDRGMITRARIEALRGLEGAKWITCLRAPQIRTLIDGGSLQLGLFDETNLAAITHPDYPDERLIACRNPDLARLRANKREELLVATEKELERLSSSAGSSKYPMALRVGRVLDRHKMAKHFTLEFDDDESFTFVRDTNSIETEAALDGIYVIRTSVSQEELDDAKAVEAYKGLSVVERNFRNLKVIDLDLRPIYHYSENRVRAHVFLSMLALYVTWHMREALAPLMFADEEIPEHHDPVAPALRSRAAELKDATKRGADGEPIHSFGTLLAHLGTLTRNTAEFTQGIQIEQLSVSTPLQRRVFELIGSPIPTTIGGK
ncbi:IS1634 family transposase [Ferrimicrobium acidiphilum]|uniref:IS1634 family transposase n=1 Tax=Ferrimicrobium acidiphilum TaxID=121039 RepID=UPI000697C6D4|nr:IS1634 family transposase [Ferrimicrobium acidiphilum]